MSGSIEAMPWMAIIEGTVCCSVDDPRHCLKYPSKVSVSKSPFRYTERNLVHPKGLYFNEKPTAYMKH